MNNLISVKSGLSVGSYDLGQIHGAIKLRKAEHGEGYTGIGKDILVVIYCFENNIDLDVLLSEARNAFERFAAAENIDSWII